MGKYKYNVSVHVGRGDGIKGQYFKRFSLKSGEYDDIEQFAEAIASEVTDTVEMDVEYREAVEGV